MPSLMKRQLPNWIQSYVEYTKHMEAPDLFHMWTAVGTIAGALRGKVWIDMGYFKWKPNFFIVLVAPPGVVSKSTTLGVGMSLLRELESIHFGPDSVTWQALTESFVEATEDVPDVGPMSPITVAASELGTFLDPRNREMVDVLCDLWDGRSVPWKRRTKGEGTSEIRNPWLNFLGCTTPGWIEENFPEYAIRGGFTSRTVFVYADAKRSLSPYPNLRLGQYKEEFAALRRSLVADLKRIAILRGEFAITKDGYAWGTEWYKQHWDPKAHDDMDKETYGGYLARKQTHIHKVAMVLSASEGDSLTIESRHLAQADYFVTELEDQMVNVFRHIADNRSGLLSQQIVMMLNAYEQDFVPMADIWRAMIYRCSIEEFTNCIRGLIAANLIRETTAGPGVIVYQLLPRGKARASSEQSTGTAARWEVLAHAGSPDGTAASHSEAIDPHESGELDAGQNR